VAGDADAPKSWLRLAFVCNADAAAELAEQLSACGALAVSLDDAEDQPLYEPASGTTPLWSQTRVSGLFRSDEDPARVLTVLEARTEPGTLRAPRVEVLADRDWVRAYRDAFEPTCFGGRLWVVPSWSQPIALADDQVRITLDPGIAFGTGHHPSTAMCLTWLAGERLHDSTVVDYGCGSGILSVAAAKLGARRVWAVDHDAQALAATRRNADANAVTDRVEVRAPEALPSLTADLLVSNILANTLIGLAETLCGLLGPAGRLALAGILHEQSSRVVARYAPWCSLRVSARDDGWVLLDGTRGNQGV
jgi:ribosomal protein L11 methyltransferase